MTSMVVQADLRAGNRFLTCWVEPRVRVGDQVTLQNSAEPELRWDVLRVGAASESWTVRRLCHNDR